LRRGVQRERGGSLRKHEDGLELRPARPSEVTAPLLVLKTYTKSPGSTEKPWVV